MLRPVTSRVLRPVTRAETPSSPVAGDYPPACSPPSPLDATFQETDGAGTCSQSLVACSDSSGRGLPVTLAVVSDATGGEVRVEGRAVTGSDTLALEVCSLGPADSNDQLLAIGQFEVTLGPHTTSRHPRHFHPPDEN